MAVEEKNVAGPVYDTPPGFYEWVEYLIAMGSSPTDIESKFLESGFSLEYCRTYMDAFINKRASGLSNNRTGRRIFCEGVNRETIPALWKRLDVIDKCSVVSLGDREAVVIAKRPESGIFLLKNFLADDECEALIKESRGKTTPSFVVDTETGGNKPDPARTSKGTSIPISHNLLVSTIEKRVSELCGLPTENQEDLQVLEYEVGKEYKPHHDYFDCTKPGYRKLLQNGGQRVCTVLMYLNDCNHGGETIFPELGIGFQAQKGNALIFANADNFGLLLEWSRHAGRPVDQGEKWVATKWVRSGRYTP